MYNGNSTRSGSQVLELRETRSVTSTLTMQSTNIEISKAEHQIVSGSTSFELSGTFGNGTTFAKTGTITYLGNRSATVEVNRNVYEVQW